MALLPCTCIYGPAPADVAPEGTLVALARDPWCPASAVHNRPAPRPAQPTRQSTPGTRSGDLEALG
jgi:hypothetical protein